MTSRLKSVIIEGMDLKEELQVLSGRKRQFMLLRILDVGTEAARQLCGISKGTYNTWLHNDVFVQLYRRRAELAITYKQEVLPLMRRSNQLQAILLEEKIIGKMKDEIKSGEYNLIKTNLAREVYSKLISDLDYQPPLKSLTWQQRIEELNIGQQTLQLEEGAVIEGEFREVKGDDR